MASDDPLADVPPAFHDDDADVDARRSGAEGRGVDQFAPPAEPCECHCLHCGRTFMSDGIWFQKVINDPGGFEGFWMCPTPNCDGAGFTFDIHPTDPNHPANEGWVCCDDEECEFDEEIPYGDEADDETNPDAEWDPAEAKYKALDEIFDDDDDIEGEEWKYGLPPGEKPPDPAYADQAWAEEARLEEEEEERRYNEPDRRPRVVDWSDRPDRRDPTRGQFDDDDIPF